VQTRKILMQSDVGTRIN